MLERCTSFGVQQMRFASGHGSPPKLIFSIFVALVSLSSKCPVRTPRSCSLFQNSTTLTNGIKRTFDSQNSKTTQKKKQRKQQRERDTEIKQRRSSELMEVVCFPAVRFSPRQPLILQRCGRGGIRCAEVLPAAMGEKTEYKDGFFEKAFMGLFARKMEKFASGGTSKRGLWEWDYESFVDVSRRVMVGRSRNQQQEVVREVLLSILPPGAPAQFRKLFPPTKWAAEFNAALTVPFFHWLVGPSEVIEVEVDGVMQRSGVRIKKCRYLENSGCVGMCVNMCKYPTQDFFTNEFGLPLTMKPNFEDMSCEMLYGQAPPPFEEDPASKQPCYTNMCSLASSSSPFCPKLQN